ncbi:GLPGLI family protein [Chitinophagaceae bacterium MMS25-I14]
MNRYILPILFLMLTATAASAQYTAQGTIEYERKVNVHRQMEDYGEDWFEQMKAQVPKFSSSFFNLYFDTQKTLYKPGKESDNQFRMFGGSPAADNVVYTNLPAKKVTAEKVIYEKKYLVQDSMRVLKWKITDEIRTIANYKCHKAVGKICDSVYVVAFYTDDIMVSGGPEMFSGLPGMILELAVPRLYTTWVATKVDIAPPPATTFVAPAKGKVVTQQQLVQNLQESLKDWGKWANRNIWWSSL